jgi:hypothetical protein
MLVACGSFTKTSVEPVSYRGILLPTPAPVRGFSEQPPPAWLIVGQTATPATFGSFCLRGACADMAMPQARNDLVATKLAATSPVTIVIQVTPIKDVDVRVSDWTNAPTAPFDPAHSRGVRIEHTSIGAFTVLVVDLIGNAGDQLLTVAVTFESGDASYLWRLNPAA